MPNKLNDTPSNGPINNSSNELNITWYKTWGGPGIDFAHDMAVDSNDNIYIYLYTMHLTILSVLLLLSQ